MNIYVLMKRTFDVEEQLVIEDGVILDDDAEFIINPYDEYAIEEAVTVRNDHGGKVTVLTVGNEDADKELRTALAMGADEAVLINIEEEVEEYDEADVAKVLTEYLQDKEADLILAGNVAVDGGTGQTGPRVAEQLGINCVTSITKLTIEGKSVEIVRDVEGDTEVLTTELPLLVTAQQGLNEPTYPSLPGIMQAKKKPLEELELDDLDLDEDDVEEQVERVECFLPPQKSAGQKLEGSPQEQVTQLINFLTDKEKVLG